MIRERERERERERDRDRNVERQREREGLRDNWRERCTTLRSRRSSHGFYGLIT